jgi:hypothetical protein
MPISPVLPSSVFSHAPACERRGKENSHNYERRKADEKAVYSQTLINAITGGGTVRYFERRLAVAVLQTLINEAANT